MESTIVESICTMISQPQAQASQPQAQPQAMAQVLLW